MGPQAAAQLSGDAFWTCGCYSSVHIREEQMASCHWEDDEMAISVPDLSEEWDKTKLRNWMKNAKRLNRNDVYRAALRQLCKIEGRNIDDPLESGHIAQSPHPD